MNIGAVLLAAGQSSRFGKNKLLEDFCGTPVVCRAMDALCQVKASRMAVVTGCREVEALGRSHGFSVIVNGAPQAGLSHSITLGVRAMADMDAVLLVAADMPLLTGDSLCALVRAFVAGGYPAACLGDETHWGNPALFSRACFGALCALAGDRGAKGVLRSLEGRALVVPCLHPGELADADTPQLLAQLAKRARVNRG